MIFHIIVLFVGLKATLPLLFLFVMEKINFLFSQKKKCFLTSFLSSVQEGHKRQCCQKTSGKFVKLPSDEFLQMKKFDRCHIFGTSIEKTNVFCVTLKVTRWNKIALKWEGQDENRRLLWRPRSFTLSNRCRNVGEPLQQLHYSIC